MVGSSPPPKTMDNNNLKYRVGRHTGKVVLTVQGSKEVAHCTGENAKENAQMICNALNHIYGVEAPSKRVGLLNTLISHLRLWICRLIN